MLTRLVVLNDLSQEIQERIDLLHSDLADIRLSMGEETKSSAGDKYETSREMMQQELEKLSLKITEYRKHLAFVKQWKEENTSEFVKAGSIVVCDKTHFIIGLGIGKLSISNIEFLAVSSQAPLSQLLLGKKKGERIKTNQVFEIVDIL